MLTLAMGDDNPNPLQNKKVEFDWLPFITALIKKLPINKLTAVQVLMVIALIFATIFFKIINAPPLAFYITLGWFCFLVTVLFFRDTFKR